MKEVFKQKKPAAIVLVLFFAVAVLFFAFQVSKEKPLESSTGFAVIEEKTGGNPLLEQRKGYGITLAVFSELPSPPNDFTEMLLLYRKGKLKDEFFFSNEYFLQPEFFEAFLAQGLKYWTKPSKTHYGAVGYGTFPVEKTIHLKAGESAKARFFFHSGFGVQSFQGIQLNKVFLNSVGERFLSVSIKEPVFLLGPTYPKFHRDWVKDVVVTVKVKENTPRGSYVIGFKPVAPPKELSKKWRNSFPKYFDAGFFSPNVNFFSLVAVVE